MMGLFVNLSLVAAQVVTNPLDLPPGEYLEKSIEEYCTNRSSVNKVYDIKLYDWDDFDLATEAYQIILENYDECKIYSSHILGDDPQKSLNFLNAKIGSLSEENEILISFARTLVFTQRLTFKEGQRAAPIATSTDYVKIIDFLNELINK